MSKVSDQCLMCHWYCDEVLEECKGQEEPCHEFILSREYRDNKMVMRMSDLAHIDIIHKIPEYKRSTKKGDKRKIKEIMRQYEFDDDVIENINDDFCNGWDAARCIIIEMLKDKYWKHQEKINERSESNE